MPIHRPTTLPNTTSLNTLSFFFSFFFPLSSFFFLFFLLLRFFFFSVFFLSSFSFSFAILFLSSSSSFSFLKNKFSLSPPLFLYQIGALFKSEKNLSTKPPCMAQYTHTLSLSLMVAVSLGFGLICILPNGFSVVFYFELILFWVDFELGLWWFSLILGWLCLD